MRFNKYLEELLGSRVKVKILRTLFKFYPKVFTVRELASQVNVSHTAVLKSLDSLQGMNILGLESHGTSNLIHLNKDSEIFSVLSTLFSEEREALNKLKQEIKKIYPQARTIGLFGSIARGDESLNSDLDILIIANEKKEIESRIAEKQQEFSQRFGNVISAIIMTESEYQKKKNSPLMQRIKKDFILLKGTEL